MKVTALYNLSGRAIPDNVEIAISGQPAPGDVLVIEAFDGIHGTASWRTAAELKTRREQAASKAAGRPSWQPPLKPNAPYS